MPPKNISPESGLAFLERFLRDDLGVSPVLGTIIMVGLATAMAAGGGAAVATGAVDLPEDPPSSDFRLYDAPDRLDSSPNELVYLEHMGGDSIDVDDLAAVVETPNGSKRLSGDQLALKIDEGGDRFWEVGETLVVVETCDESGSGDHDKGHGNDDDGVDEDNPGKSGEKKGQGKESQERTRARNGEGPQGGNGGDDVCLGFNGDDEVVVTIYHGPTGRVVAGSGANVD